MKATLTRGDGAKLDFEGSAEEFEKACAAFAPPTPSWTFPFNPPTAAPLPTMPYNPLLPFPGVTWTFDRVAFN